MSVPNAAHLEPQRGGCCTVMPYFVGDILELPLTTTQDYSLFHILGDYSTALWKAQTELILSKNGLISFITHPDYLSEQRALAVYTELLAHLAQLRDRTQRLGGPAGRGRPLVAQPQPDDAGARRRLVAHRGAGQRARAAWRTPRSTDDRVVYTLDDAS